MMIGLSIDFNVSERNIDELEVESFSVVKAGFERFKTGFRYTGKIPRSSADYYEFAVYSESKRFFLRNPDIEGFSNSIPYLTKGDSVKIWHSESFDSEIGYEIYQIAKDGRVSYSLMEKQYENEHKNWLLICMAVVFFLIAGIFYAVSIPSES